MNEAITIKQLVEIIAIIGGLWGGYKVIVEIIHTLNDKHDKVQKWDDYDGKLQQIQAEQCMLTYCMMATLDGLHQLGCNGKVTEARQELDKFMNKSAHNQ